MNTEYLFEKLRSAPVGFGVDETEVWLSDIPEIQSLSEIEDVFLSENLSINEIDSLGLIIKRKYIESSGENIFSGGCFENQIKRAGISDIYSGLSISQDSSSVLDFSALNKKLIKLEICIARKAQKIILPNNSSFEALDISHTPKLECIENVELLKKIKILSLRNCTNHINLQFIEKLSELRILSLSDNKNLPELDFFNESNPIIILNLALTNAIKLKRTIANLSKLKKLKHLNIKANQKELRQLREHLPKCIVNGFSFDQALKAGL
ncbi:hypothetical protein [Flavobacterium sp. 140616W15]|uniref:hypothetical protein n=1 Tax=Flavobacterium sp. 140616W15 TaxID=2478552 RepID=UPI000F0C7E1C|nr:hypothetical protein [Flavobacterium sp. 140616W15]AYN05635.1 hypothetical protein EAG11_16870 [Flavobacterium sp. 140616W15]